MADASILGTFLLLTLGILVVPGPDVLYVMARSLGQGRSAGLLSVIGIGAGVLVHTALAAFGLSRLFLAVPAAYQVVKYAGIAYLLYLAYGMIRARSDGVVAGTSPDEPPARLVRQAFLTNLLNPKAALFFLALLPQFTRRSGDALFGELLALGLMVVAMSMTVNTIYAFLAAHVAKWFRGNVRAQRVQRWTSAGVLGIIAALALRASMPGDA